MTDCAGGDRLKTHTHTREQSRLERFFQDKDDTEEGVHTPVRFEHCAIIRLRELEAIEVDFEAAVSGEPARNDARPVSKMV